MTTIIKPKPLSYCAQLIPLVLSGAKTETMRVVKPQPYINVSKSDNLSRWIWAHRDCKGQATDNYCTSWLLGRDEHILGKAVADAYKLQPGEVFYINEKIEILDAHHGALIRLRYLADGLEADVPWPTRIKHPDAGLWRGRVIPVEWARPFRGTVQTVVGKRLREMDYKNAKAEGMSIHVYPACGDHPDMYGYVTPADGEFGAAHTTWEKAFAKLWNEININTAHQWDANPWVTSIAWTAGGEA